MFVCIKQHLSKIWSPIYEKVKQHRGWVEKTLSWKKTSQKKKKRAYQYLVIFFVSGSWNKILICIFVLVFFYILVMLAFVFL